VTGKVTVYINVVSLCYLQTKRHTDKQAYSRGKSKGRSLKIFLVEVLKVITDHNNF